MRRSDTIGGHKWMSSKHAMLLRGVISKSVREIRLNFLTPIVLGSGSFDPDSESYVVV